MKNQQTGDKYQFDRFQRTLGSHQPLKGFTKTENRNQVIPFSNNNIIYLTDYIQRERNTNPIITELKQLLADKEEWKEDGIILETSSINHAIKFVTNSIIPYGLASPEIEVHPDGEVAFTWQKNTIGIMNIAFAIDGIATWAAYLLTQHKRTFKGRFYVEDSITDIEKNIIRQIRGL